MSSGSDDNSNFQGKDDRVQSLRQLAKWRATARVLTEALPHILRYDQKTVVVKYGGNAMGEEGVAEHFAQDIVLMRQVGMRPVVVHGGGPQISDLMGRLGKQSEFRNGLRVTDGETIDIVRMVLIGQVNPQLVAAINVHGPLAVGVSGEDAGLIRAAARHVDLGFVGDVESINPTILNALLDDEFIPVVATIGTDVDGQAYNINADTAAGAIANCSISANGCALGRSGGAAGVKQTGTMDNAASAAAIIQGSGACGA